MYANYIYYNILGIPLFAYFGIIAFSLLVLTILVPYINKKLKKKIPLVWHHRLGISVVCFAVLHVSLITIARI